MSISYSKKTPVLTGAVLLVLAAAAAAMNGDWLSSPAQTAASANTAKSASTASASTTTRASSSIASRRTGAPKTGSSLSTSWVPTATGVLPLKAAVTFTPAPALMPMHIAIGLALQNQSALTAEFANLHTPGNPEYGMMLSTNDFVSRYSATAAQAQQVADYLTSAGFTQVTIAPNRLIITAAADAAQVESAFNMSIVTFTQINTGKTVFVNSSPALVPAALGSIVTGVLGLQNAAPFRHLAGSPDPSNLTVPLSPQQLATAYGASGFTTGSATVIAIIASGDVSAIPGDLLDYETEFKLPQVPTSIVQTDSGDFSDAGGQEEYDMDTQSSTGIAGNVKQLLVYDSSTLDDDPQTAEFNRFVSDNIAKAGSYSVSGCEVLEAVGGEVDTLDPIFLEATMQGQTLFASTGDTGGTCYDPATGPAGGTNGVTDTGIPGVGYPASSPYIVAAGGTTLELDSTGAYSTELAWNAGGGGPSVIEAAPDWQSVVVPTANATGKKGIPDVAMDADFLLSPAAIVVSGADTSNGGTSLSSPLSLGAWARIETAHCNSYGFAAPLFYNLATAALTADPGFNDITLGTNGTYPATAGWDYTTGLGSYQISTLSGLLPATQCATPITTNNPPIAVIIASITSGYIPLAVNFDGSGSSDPDAGDSVASYTFNFGDGTAPVTQTTAAISHTYTTAGSFTATLTVKDTHGAQSTVASVVISALSQAFGNLAACALPGVAVVTDPSGDETGAPATASLDITSVDIAEPYVSATDTSIDFTLQISDLGATGIPNSIYQISWAGLDSNGNSQKFFVTYTIGSDTIGSADYGFVDGGETPSTSTSQCAGSTTCAATGTYDSTDSRVTINLDISKALSFTPETGSKTAAFTATFPRGVMLQSVAGATQLLVGASVVGGLLETVDSTSTGTYTIQGNAFCATASGSTTGSGSTGGTSGGGSSTGGSSGGTSGASSTGGGTSGGTTSSGTSGGGSSTGGSSTGGTTSSGSTGGDSTGGSSGGTTSGSTSGGTSGGSSTGGTSGGSSTGSTSGGSTGGSSTGGSTGSSTGGGSTTGSSTGGTSTGGTSTGSASTGGSSGGATGGSTTGSGGGSSTGGTSGGSSTGGSSTGGGTSTGGTGSGGSSSGGSSTSGLSTGGSTGGATPTDNPPIASLSASPNAGTAPLNVELDASASSDPDAGDSVASYTFRFGDDSAPVTQSSPTTSHVYTAKGSYTASVTVTDTHGMQSLNQGAAQIMVSMAASTNSAPTASMTATPTSGTPPMTVSFNASGSSDPDNGDHITVYTFNFGDGSNAVSQSGPTISHVYSTEGDFTATLTVTDSNGATSTNVSAIDIQAQSVTTMPAVNVSGSGSGALPPVALGGLAALAALRRKRRKAKIRSSAQG